MSAFDGDRQGPGLIRFRYRWQIQSRAAFLLFAGAVLLLISDISIARSRDCADSATSDTHAVASRGIMSAMPPESCPSWSGTRSI